jgi:hypothetical protein
MNDAANAAIAPRELDLFWKKIRTPKCDVSCPLSSGSSGSSNSIVGEYKNGEEITHTLNGEKSGRASLR